jgi:hypothetical protein
MNNSDRFVKVPRLIWAFVIGACLLGALSKNPLYTILSVLAVPVLIKLLWRTAEPPVLFLGALLQWLTITIKVFYADFYNLDFADPTLHIFSAQINKTFILSLFGLFCFALGVHLPIRNIASHRVEDIKNLTKDYNVRKTIIFYIVCSFFSSFLLANMSVYPGLTQLLASLAGFKWSLLFFLCLLVVNRNEYKGVLYAILAMETILGFANFFSAFKDSILLFVIALLTLGHKLKPKHIAVITIIIFLLVNFGILWTYSKSPYRTYLSAGELGQELRVSRTDALKKLYEIVGTIDIGKYKEALRDMIFRLSYIDFFSACVDYVPRFIPHEHGEMWKDAVFHLLKPRLFFPDKPILDDVINLNKYTGLNLIGLEAATSISIGYMGDSYIDFGYFFFIPVFLLGFLLGAIYRIILTRALNLLWGNALIIPLFYACSFEVSAKKTLGYILTYAVVIYTFSRWFIPPLNRKLMIQKTVIRP